MREIEVHMNSKGFLNIDSSFCAQWEMFIVIFVKKDLRKEIQDVKKQSIAKGQMQLVGNKGCVAYSFVLRDRVFNFICCHLKHGQDTEEKRNKEASQILKELKFSNVAYKGLECDSHADFTFFFGDLNYRTNSTFSKLDKDINESMNPKLDQL